MWKHQINFRGGARMKKAILLIMVLSLVGISGCIDDNSDKPIGGDTDEHGCIGSAGYMWCEAKQKCLRTWEEPCPGMVFNFKECAALGYPVMESYPRQCRTPEGKTFVEDVEGPMQGPALEAAENYAKNMKPYTEENGRDLKINDVVQLECPGCWIVYIQYDLDLGKPTDTYTNDRVTVTITLSNWEVVDAVSGRGGVVVLSPEECIAKGGRTLNVVGGNSCGMDETNIGDVKGFISPNICCMPSEEPEKLTLAEAIEIARNSECTEKGLLGDIYVYNEYTKTWWIDLDMNEEFEQDYCNPACVVDEKTKTAEINWRCTGLIA